MTVVNTRRVLHFTGDCDTVTSPQPRVCCGMAVIS